MAPRWANIAQKSAKRGQDSQEAPDLRAARSAVSSSFLMFSCVFWLERVWKLGANFLIVFLVFQLFRVFLAAKIVAFGASRR